MKIFRLLIMLMFLVSLECVQGQVKPKPKTPPKPVTTQTATTEDGKSVVLSSDSTWKYASETREAETSSPDASTRPKGRANSVLSFETGLVFKSGDVKPVARATFYLLD